jgi:hypothetical protein
MQKHLKTVLVTLNTKSYIYTFSNWLKKVLVQLMISFDTILVKKFCKHWSTKNQFPVDIFGAICEKELKYNFLLNKKNILFSSEV